MTRLDEDRLQELCSQAAQTAAEADEDAAIAAELRVTRSLLTRHPPPAEALPSVLVSQPGVSPRWLPLLKSAVSLGRHPGNDIVIDDPGVSREHCRLLFGGETWSVQDLGSHNGTVFRDRRVRELELRSGDVLRLGPVTVLFTDGVRCPWGAETSS
jgi:hypothetical protein